MRMSTKFLAAVAFAGLAAAGGSAFTGSGVTNTAGATQFVGGTVSQAVTGATLSGVTYGFADAPANTQVSTITLAFADTADGRTVAVTPSGGAAGVGAFSCVAVTSNASTCTYTVGVDTLPGYTGLNSLAVTVS
ncbi:MAG: hypothetical protein QOE89_1486 [Pseudonocardiales bacterium]|nr:hypothetical protein [Pseudonocardiales bacterium]